MQLSLGYYNYYATIFLKYGVIINCHVRKAVYCIIVVSELIMNTLYDNLYIIHTYLVNYV